MESLSNEMLIFKEPLGPFQTNCYIIGCNTTKEAVVIDPGDEIEKIFTIIEKNSFQVKYVLLTHAHLDHCAHSTRFMKKIKEFNFLKSDAPIYMHAEEKWLYENLPLQGRMFNVSVFDPCEDIAYLKEKDKIEFGNGHSLEVIHTPGHSPGSLCYYFKNQNFVVAGDVLFEGSIGRTDLWGGSLPILTDSIKNKLFKLNDNTIVLPGHGNETLIGTERSSNPYLKDV